MAWPRPTTLARAVPLRTAYSSPAGAVLTLQGFHPENFQNQKRLWLAEEKQKQEEAARREVRRAALARGPLLNRPESRSPGLSGR